MQKQVLMQEIQVRDATIKEFSNKDVNKDSIKENEVCFLNGSNFFKVLRKQMELQKLEIQQLKVENLEILEKCDAKEKEKIYEI